MIFPPLLVLGAVIVMPVLPPKSNELVAEFVPPENVKSPNTAHEVVKLLVSVIVRTVPTVLLLIVIGLEEDGEVTDKVVTV